MINVYWSPWHHYDVYHDRALTYKPLQWLSEELGPKCERNNIVDNAFKCPAVVGQMKNTVICRSTSDIDVAFAGGRIIDRLNKPRSHAAELLSIKLPSIKNAITFNYSCNWVFFADKPLTVTSGSPYAHRTDAGNYGYYVPGTYDISKWFRPIEYAFQLWEGVCEFKVNEGDPLIYIKFNTDEQIKLHRFSFTREIYDISRQCMGVKKFNNVRSLNKLYEIFIQNRTNKTLLEEIKRNLV